MASKTYSFKAYGHPNILGTHMNTLEITKDKGVSERGNCIIAVGADFSGTKISEMAKQYGRLRVRLQVAGLTDETEFKANRDFSSDHEIVIRLGNFESERTLGTDATKSSKMLDRRMIEKMQTPGQEMTVVVEPVYKVIIFDLDGTLEDFDRGKFNAYEKLAEVFLKKYGLYPDTTVRILEDIDHENVIRGIGGNPESFDRRKWFPEFFRRAGLKVSKAEIDEYVRLYWKHTNEGAALLPGAKQAVAELRKRYHVVMMSDSDGPKPIKIERVRMLGMEKSFDYIITGDDVGQNKPSRKMYEKVFKRFGVKGRDCVMIGDKPWADLVLAKELGMKTIWMRHGPWGNDGKQYDYVDHSINDLNDLCGLLEK
ncbi:TPA: HAD-IA family hydrolase [Candidatus Woesearchaeota archaeon]|nr:HAD-IA family hydrolase [Candidatus Woesearchaeota archaeon]